MASSLRTERTALRPLPVSWQIQGTARFREQHSAAAGLAKRGAVRLSIAPPTFGEPPLAGRRPDEPPSSSRSMSMPTDQLPQVPFGAVYFRKSNPPREDWAR